LGVLLAVGAGVAAAQGSDPLRPPDGEWIPSVVGETARVWAVGDANPPNSKRVTRLIKRADPDRVLYLGDVYGLADGAAAFERWAKPWGYLLNQMAPTPGNHEWKQAPQGYEQFWRDITGETPPTYYSFKAGGWEILAVNGEHSDSDAIATWLTEQAGAGGNCRIAFWHRPAYSAGKYERGDAHARQYWDALVGGARIILNGHDHDMQRLRARDGIVEFISGAGGRHRHNVDEKDPDLAFGDDDHFGALRLRLSPERAKWRFVTARGHVLDKGSLFCQT
jgi:acid phosphatase type 7